MVLLLAFLAVLATASAAKEQSRWSRQISSYTSDISDWVPLSGPVDEELPQIRRQAIAEPRILTEPFPAFAKPAGFGQDVFPSRAFYNSPANRQLYLQSVPSAPQNYLSEQGFNQGLRFGLTQPNFPLSQGFIGPQFTFDNIPQLKPRPQPVPTPIKFENSRPKPSVPITTPVKSFSNEAVKGRSESPKFVDGYRAENNSDSMFAKKKPQSLQKIKFENSDKSKEVSDTPKTKVEREEVQLLYMPVESLNGGQFNFRSPFTSAQLLNAELYNQNSRQNPIMQIAGEIQRPVVQPTNIFNSQEFLSKFNSQLHETDNISKFTTITTPFPTTLSTTPKLRKLKPHQPPLAIFLTNDAKNNEQLRVGDVLHSLKNANTVAVLDSVNPLNAPKVFIGPSSLLPPENYVKFELPYLSNIENIDKKLKQLPFFVAPLSYNTPQGFAKIPFPSPHVGSVVINSLIKDTPSINKPTVLATDVNTNSYSRPSIYQQKQNPITQKPIISYYSTSTPKTTNFEPNDYSIEPQPVKVLKPIKNLEANPVLAQSTPYKTGTYFLHNSGNQYNPSQFINFPAEVNYRTPESTKVQNAFKLETTTTVKTIGTSTSKPSSRYPSQLLETHNPYSINQAFHFSTPLEYQNFFDEYKEAKPNQVMNQPLLPPSYNKYNTISPALTPSTKKEEIEEQKTTAPPQQSPNYLQNYNPEIQHVSDINNSRYPVFNTNDYFPKTDTIIQTDNSNDKIPVTSESDIQTNSNTNPSLEDTGSIETQTPISENYTIENSQQEGIVEDTQSTKLISDYNQYDSNYNSQEILSSTSSTTTTTTRRTPIRSRGRPRYPTIKPESYEYSTRPTITRRPLRERKPLPIRSKYEPNKITADTSTRKPLDSSESTTKSARTRIRGRVQYKPSENDDIYTKRNKPSSKENDLAYQRDILHQNYPVTLMERTSTLDIEAITEPTDKRILTNNLESIKTDDTIDAYSHDKVSIAGPITSESKDILPSYTTAVDSITEIPKTSTYYDNYNYETKSSMAPRDALESENDPKEERYDIVTSPDQESVYQDTLFATKETLPVTEQNAHIYSNIDEIVTTKQDEVTYAPEGELNTGIISHEINQEQEQEDNIVETTPSYNRVRVRPGVIRQYHQASSTESSRSKTDRRTPLKTITYRPAFDRRRTTMRIEEIEADLKTKQVHVRPEFQDYKQPVYKPDPTLESITTSSTTETSSKHNQFRRRRPSYATTSTEGPTVSRRPYEVKNRFRGRRPTEKPTEKSELSTEISTTTLKNSLYNRYSHRPRLSERYNKKEETEDHISEDQDSNYSINRPKYVAPETDHWSPKITKDSFKPYNPNNIADDTKTEISNAKSQDKELDIITAKNEFEDILISVTPATNNRVNKKIPDIPPTLEALVEQSKVTKSDSTDTMSTFESMLEEVMKSLEEQDENEYTSKVMKHKGGEIGEIPPERIISSGENYSLKSTTSLQGETTTASLDNATSYNITEEVPRRKNRRRGFWKKVKVRPATEEIDVAESQYYPHVINRLGQYVSKTFLEKPAKGNSKVSVTTYKPNYHFLKEFFETDEEMLDAIPNMDIAKINTIKVENTTKAHKESITTTVQSDITVPTEKNNLGDMDLGTGSPDPTFDDMSYYSQPTEATSSSVSHISRSDRFSFMDYLFGVTSPDHMNIERNDTATSSKDITKTTQLPKGIEIETEASKIKATTETTYVPDEITTEIDNNTNDSVAEATVDTFIQKINKEIKELTEKSILTVESSSVSSFMDPANVVSTSMSTEVSHETEICFRGKCIKTNKNIL